MHESHIDGFQETHAIEHSLVKSERRTWIVVLVSAAMMVLELVVGFVSGSIALLADGVHMATHVGALGLSGLAYFFARRWSGHRAFTFGTGKVFALSGFTSALILLGTAVWMAFESISRLVRPEPIAFAEALPVAVLGFVINLVCALILGHDHDHGGHGHGHSHGSSGRAHHGSPGRGHAHHDHPEDDHARHDHARHDHAHHDHAHHDHPADHDEPAPPSRDHNFEAARLHILADALTSIFAIVALVAGRYFEIALLDPVVGVVGALVVGRWAVGLSAGAAKQLLDVAPSLSATEALKRRLEEVDDVTVADLHLWEIGPGKLACIVKIVSAQPRDATFYREVVRRQIRVAHLTVEVQRCRERHEHEVPPRGDEAAADEAPPDAAVHHHP
jgi:cation diffusion facilitator family transporter